MFRSCNGKDPISGAVVKYKTFYLWPLRSGLPKANTGTKGDCITTGLEKEKIGKYLWPPAVRRNARNLSLPPLSYRCLFNGNETLIDGILNTLSGNNKVHSRVLCSSLYRAEGSIIVVEVYIVFSSCLEVG